MKFEKPWNGVPLSGDTIAFDTETTVVDNSREIPRLCVLSASDGERTVLVGPDQVLDFIEAQCGLLNEADWVGWNTSFDWWVIREHLIQQAGSGGGFVGGWWFDLLDEGRIHDGMLLEQLLRLAEGRDDEPFHRIGLKAAAFEYCGLELDKDDDVRQGFTPDLFDRDDPSLERHWEYAARDAEATLAVWRVLAERAVQARDRMAGGVRPLPGMGERFGVLTETLQTRAAVTLDGITRNGFGVNRSVAAEKLREGLGRAETAVETLRRVAPGLVKTYKSGQVKLTKGSGLPQMNVKELQRLLTQVAKEKNLTPPLTAKSRVVSTAADWWSDNAMGHPLVDAWVGLQEEAKSLQLLGNVQEVDEVHSTYNPLVRTGRVSARDPNIQQIPRESWFRSLFVARPGHLLVTLDFSFIELRTLAAIIESRTGKSTLGQTIRAGKCPHTNTAAMVRGEPYDVVAAAIKNEKRLPEGSLKPYSHDRQAAKAINFGVPGGLGATKLAAYAKKSYGVDMTVEQARTLRDKLITEVYPELSHWLEDDLAARLGWSLGCSRSAVERVFGKVPQWGDPCESPVARVVEGRLYRKDGAPLAEYFVNSVWVGLEHLIGPRTDPAVAKAIRFQRAGPDLHQHLFKIPSVTLTGRSRLKTFYGDFRNTQFQGLAADGAKVALWELFKAGYKVVAFVHDEIVTEVPDEGDGGQRAGKAIEKICVEAFQKVMPDDFPIGCEWGCGPCWAKG